MPWVHVSSGIFTRVRDIGMRPFNDLFCPGEKRRFSTHGLIARQLFGIVRFQQWKTYAARVVSTHVSRCNSTRGRFHSVHSGVGVTERHENPRQNVRPRPTINRFPIIISFCRVRSCQGTTYTVRACRRRTARKCASRTLPVTVLLYANVRKCPRARAPSFVSRQIMLLLLSIKTRDERLRQKCFSLSAQEAVGSRRDGHYVDIYIASVRLHV